jgi:hypothetical protein
MNTSRKILPTITQNLNLNLAANYKNPKKKNNFLKLLAIIANCRSWSSVLVTHRIVPIATTFTSFCSSPFIFTNLAIASNFQASCVITLLSGCYSYVLYRNQFCSKNSFHSYFYKIETCCQWLRLVYMLTNSPESHL